MQTQNWRAVLLAMAFAGLYGCATPSRQASADLVDGLIVARSAADLNIAHVDDDGGALEKRVAELLAQPLSAEHAIALALLKNPRVQIEYARLGLARADLIDASRLSNPRLAVLRTRGAGEPRSGFTRTLSQNFTELILLGARSQMAKAQLQRTQVQVGAAVLDLASEVETAWFEAVGAIQVQAMRAAVARAAALSAQLAQRFFAAGNLPQLALATENAASSQAQIDAQRASAAAGAARSTLAGLLGVRSRDDWRLLERLAAPLAEHPDIEVLIKLAAQQRLDLQASALDVATHQHVLKLARRWRFFGEIELGVERETESSGARLRGLEATLELPIFQQGQASIARAQAELEAGKAQAAQLHLAIDNDVSLALDRMQAMQTVAEQYRSTLVPQREAIVAGTQRELNFMFKGAFDLLLVKQHEYDAYQGYLEAVRDYWIARTELKRAVGGRRQDSLFSEISYKE